VESANLARARSFLQRAAVADCHCDTLLEIYNGQRSLGQPNPEGHLDLPRLVQTGVNLQFFALFADLPYLTIDPLPRTLEMIDFFARQVPSLDDLFWVKSAKDLNRIGAQRVGGLLSLEGGEAITSTAILRVLFNLGVRALGLTWNYRNRLAEGAGEATAGGGLTKLGVDIVREANRLGMVVDVSHLAEKSFWNVLEHSAKPVLASHSNCRSLLDHPRNLSDEQLKALAQNGGVVAINFVPAFLGRPAGVATVARHIEHAVDLAGIDHVALGSDFDGTEELPQGLENVTQLDNLAAELFSRGCSEADLRKIFGENVLRLLQECLPRDDPKP